MEYRQFTLVGPSNNRVACGFVFPNGGCAVFFLYGSNLGPFTFPSVNVLQQVYCGVGSNLYYKSEGIVKQF